MYSAAVLYDEQQQQKKQSKSILKNTLSSKELQEKLKLRIEQEYVKNQVQKQGNKGVSNVSVLNLNNLIKKQHSERENYHEQRKKLESASGTNLQDISSISTRPPTSITFNSGRKNQKQQLQIQQQFGNNLARQQNSNNKNDENDNDDLLQEINLCQQTERIKSQNTSPIKIQNLMRPASSERVLRFNMVQSSPYKINQRNGLQSAQNSKQIESKNPQEKEKKDLLGDLFGIPLLNDLKTSNLIDKRAITLQKITFYDEKSPKQQEKVVEKEMEATTLDTSFKRENNFIQNNKIDHSIQMLKSSLDQSTRKRKMQILEKKLKQVKNFEVENLLKPTKRNNLIPQNDQSPENQQNETNPKIKKTFFSMFKSHTGINEEDELQKDKNENSKDNLKKEITPIKKTFSFIKRRAVLNPVKEQFSKFYNLLSEKNEEISNIIKQRESYKKLYLILFELSQAMLESGDNFQFILFLIFCGDLLSVLGDDHKSFYFYNQARKICDWVQKYSYLKIQIYRKMGDVCLHKQKYNEAIRFFKKQLQYSWFYQNQDEEILAYDKLGLSYYYLFDIQKSQLYHTRAAIGDCEFKDSISLKIGVQDIKDYQQTQHFKQPRINQLLFAHLNLPLQTTGIFSQEILTAEEKKRTDALNKISLQTKMDLFNILLIENYIEQVFQEDEFKIDVETPKHSQRSKMEFLQPNNLNSSHSPERVQHYPDPKWMKPDHDVKSLGKMKIRNASERNYADVQIYKLSLDKRIEYRLKQKFNASESIQRAYSNVDIWVKHVGNLNNRVRVVHKSTNRVANNFQNYQKCNGDTVIKMIEKYSKQFLKSQMNKQHNNKNE